MASAQHSQPDPGHNPMPDAPRPHAGESFMRDWTAVGAEVSRFDGVVSEYPFLVAENGSSGRHWIHARSNVAIPKGAAVEFSIALRPLGLSRLRLRLDLGGKAVQNGSVGLDEERHQAEDLERLKVATTPYGFTHIDAAYRSPVDAGYLNFGMMFERGSGIYDYPGADAGLIVESVAVRVVDTLKLQADSSIHSRYSAFGRKAHELCRGNGLEIGALHRPFDLDAHVTYLDYERTAQLKQAYRRDERVGDIRQVQLVSKDVEYPFLDDDAFDFVINSHVLEHVANPGRVIEEWLRIIRPGGMLYMVVPDKDFTFDRPRALTPIRHLLEDFDSRTAQIGLEHYEDYLRNREGGPKTNLDALIADAHRKQTSIHVHTFTADSLRIFLNALRSRLRFRLEHFEAQGMHVHVGLRKSETACLV